MKNLLKIDALVVGFALFSMFFGAGNVIFPLVVGQFAGDKNFYATIGLVLTAAVMPIAGAIAMILFDGSYRVFFGRLGKVPGFALALFIISLLGPLGSTPRCIALAYGTLKSIFLDVSPAAFSAVSCSLIFLLSARKNKMLSILGLVLTPLLLLGLAFVVLLGFIKSPSQEVIDQTPIHVFFRGLKEGYNTMDLLAAFFFSSTVLSMLKQRFSSSSEKKPLHVAIQASLVGAFLLVLSYIGFSYLASFHAQDLKLESQETFLAAITMKIMGPVGGILVCVIVALACLTTAMALTSAFTDFFQTEVFRNKVSYELILGGCLLLTFFVSTFEFTGICKILGPILEICYPGLIALTALNLSYHLKHFKPVKVPVFAVFAFSAIFYFMQHAI